MTSPFMKINCHVHFVYICNFHTHVFFILHKKIRDDDEKQFEILWWDSSLKDPNVKKKRMGIET